MTKRKTIERELTIEDAISEALGEITTLAEEMREAYDNTPESLQSSAAGEARGEAADALENINEPDVPDLLKGEGWKVNWYVIALSPSAQRKQSRSARCNEAVTTLNAVADRLDEIADDNASSDELKEVASSLADDVRQIIDEAEAVEFPGRYGS